MTSLREMAQGQQCTLRLPGHCSWDRGQTMLCHLRLPGVAGTALKPDDLLAVIGCHGCHQVIDGHVGTDLPWSEIDRAVLDALGRTLLLWKRNGLVQVVV